MLSPQTHPWLETETLGEHLKARGVSRREFLAFCGQITAVLGLGEMAIPRVVQALQTVKRPSVIWLQLQECTGCVEKCHSIGGTDDRRPDTRSGVSRLPTHADGRGGGCGREGQARRHDGQCRQVRARGYRVDTRSTMMGSTAPWEGGPRRISWRRRHRSGGDPGRRSLRPLG